MSILEIQVKNLAATAPFSFIGAAKAALQIAAIKAMFAAVKGLVSKGFYDGGFTPSGSWDQPQGVVHSNEFVANRHAVANPSIRPALNLIDYAQRTGTVNRLTGDDIAAVVSPYHPSAVGQRQGAAANRENEILAAITALAKTTNAMTKRLNEPFVTVNTVTGRHGIKSALDEYEQLNNNKTRDYDRTVH